MKIKFSTNKQEINIHFVHKFLSETSYWAKGRTLEVVAETIRNSFCIGAYIDDAQVGFARVVTDFQTFAYVMDFFVATNLKNKGVGTKMLSMLLDAPELQQLSRFTLSTVEASDFYQKSGFQKSINSYLVWDRKY